MRNIFSKRKRTSTGAISVATSGTAVFKKDGWAVIANGDSLVTTTSPTVKAIRQGLTFDAISGALYVVDAAPSASSVVRSGMAITNGALNVSSSTGSVGRIAMSGLTVPSTAVKIATFGDSRANISSTVAGDANLNDKQNRAQRTAYTSQPSSMASLTFFLPDFELVANGGVSGDEASGWDSGSRAITTTELFAVESDVVVIQYGTNDAQNDVSSAATRDSVSARVIQDLKEIIAAILATGRKVVWETTMQRSLNTGAFAYGEANGETRRDCIDLVNNAMITWVEAHGQYGTNLALSDLRALMNEGAATSGAYIDPLSTYMVDGAHVTWLGGIECARITSQALRSLYPSVAAQKTLVSGAPTNLITGVSATNVFNPATGTSNATGGAFTFGTDSNGFPYVEQTVTVTGANASFPIDVAADIGTNNGRTAPNTVEVGDTLQARFMVTVDAGDGSPSDKVWNIYCQLVATYIGGSPAAQVLVNGHATNGTAVMTGDFDEAIHQVWGLQLTGDSSLIGAPASGAGLRYQARFYATTGTGTFRIRITNPEIRKMP